MKNVNPQLIPDTREMKTITYNPETHVLVPREPSEEMIRSAAFHYSSDEYTGFISTYKAALSAAPQPEPVEGEPVYQVCMADSVSLSGAWIDVDKQTYHDAGLYKEYKLRALYTTPKPDLAAKVAELEAKYYVAEAAVTSSHSAIENCRLYAARHRKEEWATHILRFCTESGVIGSVLRDSDLLLESRISELTEQVKVAKAALKVARDGIDKFLVANDPTEFGCACDLSVGYLCGPCHADKQQQPLKSALAKINEVLK